MKHEDNEYFDLPALLKLDWLYIQRIADNESPPSLGEYFDLLWQFLELAPGVVVALNRCAKLEEDKVAFKNISDIIPLLEQLGCDKFNTSFHAILDAYNEGDWKRPGELAQNIINDFNEFRAQILATRKKKSFYATDAFSEKSSLKKYLLDINDEEFKRKLIVVAIDDAKDILKAVFDTLRDTYRVIPLDSASTLEDTLQMVTPELFLLDYKMPGLSGFEIVPIIRSCKGHEDTPIIFLTSEGTKGCVSTAIALGACDFIVKPFEADMLRNKIAKHIVRKKQI
jgi:CheY-like chemotaxis protein